MIDKSIVLDIPNQISLARLFVLCAAVKLELKGMKRRGRSATTIVKEMLGLPRNCRKETTLAKLEEHIAVLKKLNKTMIGAPGQEEER